MVVILTVEVITGWQETGCLEGVIFFLCPGGGNSSVPMASYDCGLDHSSWVRLPLCPCGLTVSFLYVGVSLLTKISSNPVNFGKLASRL